MKRQIITLICVLSLITAMAQEQKDTTITSPHQNLREVVVKGKRTLVKMKGNAMVYKAGTLRARYAPTTAYDLLTKVPSVTDSGNSVSLIGANNLMVVIDGKVVTMEQEQVYQQLKSLTADKVKDIEIYYNAPAQYHFNGAVINVITTLGNQNEISLFLDGSLKQTRKTSTEDKASLLFSNKLVTSLSSVGYTRNNQWSSNDYRLYNDATFSNPYRTRKAKNRSYGDKYNVSEDLTFQFTPENRLTLDYYGIFAHDNSITNTNIWQQSQPNILALSREYTKETLHTVGLQMDIKMDGHWVLAINPMYLRSDSNIFPEMRRKTLFYQTTIYNSHIRISTM